MSERVPCDGVNDPKCVARFWGKVGEPATNGCRIWLGAMVGKGGTAGQFRGGLRDSRNTRAKVYVHIFAWVLANGRPVPHGLDILHSCDTHGCVEASHLRAGDHPENMLDRSRRFVNSAGGEGHGGAKLTHAQARQIYDLVQSRQLLHREIAFIYGVSRETVSTIGRGESRVYSVNEHREGLAA